MREFRYFYQMLCRLGLLGLFIEGRRCFGEFENLDFVAVSVHNHAAHCHGNRHVVGVFESQRVYPVIEIHTMHAFV